ncbi:MAG: hypothetical protein MAG551_02600 [Candidatus Scalindua arabica]|uniref:HepT-like domain-containing protein n=1 Tax=Candidatus Scalindua arabica TaxID=1127984 RepID=A0A942A263_9BACT|nr:hypothetical protein [Candidatus Scalindua arabica]
MNQENSYLNEIKELIIAELSNVDRLKDELKLYVNDEKARRAKGSILHDFYNSCERIFKLITKEVNGDFEAEEHWHKQLLYRMTLELKDTRPAVISKDLAASLDEFLTFRHLFRNIYGFELMGDRLDRLVETFFVVSEQFKKEIESFTNLI